MLDAMSIYKLFVLTWCGCAISFQLALYWLHINSILYLSRTAYDSNARLYCVLSLVISDLASSHHLLTSMSRGSAVSLFGRVALITGGGTGLYVVSSGSKSLTNAKPTQRIDHCSRFCKTGLQGLHYG